MRLLKKESLRVTIFYFLILLSIALWTRDIPNQLDALNLTLPELIKTSKLNDPASFATAAIEIAENGWVSSANEWILNLWPPGFILLEALIFKFMGPTAPVILVLQILAAGLFSIVLALFFSFLKNYINKKAAYILPILIFAFPISRVFLLQPIGISLGENFSVGFFLIFVMLTYLSVERKSFRYAIYAGICLALSAYFRSQFELILLSLTGWGILFVMAYGLNQLRNFTSSYSLKTTIKVIAIVLLTAHAVTFPWRIYHWVKNGSPLWVRTSSVIIENSVQTNEYLKSVKGEFVIAGGGNLVCRINPPACGDSQHAKEAFFKTFMEHPGEWYRLKFDVIGEYWFSSLQNWGNPTVPPKFFDFFENALLLIAIIVSAVMLLTNKIRSHISWLSLIWLNASLISAYALIFTFAHFEVRYFYFPKIIGMVMLTVASSLYLFRRREHSDFSFEQVSAKAYPT